MVVLKFWLDYKAIWKTVYIKHDRKIRTKKKCNGKKYIEEETHITAFYNPRENKGIYIHKKKRKNKNQQQYKTKVKRS